MQLRRWQQACHDTAIAHFYSGYRQFGCLATPGAGKTVFAAVTIKRLLDLDMIDYVICVAPSLTVKAGLQRTFEQALSLPMDGQFNAVGVCMTYQSLASLHPALLNRLRSYRLAIVVDEIHHCGGQDKTEATAWADPLLALTSQNEQAYTLSLSGTPWRSDRLPVTTLRYNALFSPQMHYCYGLKEAIADGVCRAPIISVIDNEHWTVTHERDGDTRHDSLASLISHDGLRYEMVLENPLFVNHMLSLSVYELTKRRRRYADAGGLVIASSIAHAKYIQTELQSMTNEPVCIITSEELNSQEKLRRYRKSNQKWLVTVGMVTEGTDIPRLQVCCHLSRICTELHFRQVLGRVLRCRGKHDANTAVLFIPAQPDLVTYANRLQCEVPDAVVIERPKLASTSTILVSQTSTLPLLPADHTHDRFSDDNNFDDSASLSNTPLIQAHSLTSTNTVPSSVVSVSAYGKYKEEVLRYI
ncbi:DEAD/DEAH box helicase [Alteromonas oceanisediminis]|uniref:DEAD/DEAH box helicase n=1 Tax=Alteromonas oceanisediminis TaxID=2836180 RepID=UPI001BD9D9DC|nr:DEAD/DEAH box helicase family protein [Alteromonas oceanisediminis]MBT0587036.1 DEAD/DEAH box helicase family protein [Alteromonas oceanisediminis]